MKELLFTHLTEYLIQEYLRVKIRLAQIELEKGNLYCYKAKIFKIKEDFEK